MFVKAKKIIETNDRNIDENCYINSAFIDVLHPLFDEDNGCYVYTCFLTNDEDTEYEITEEELKRLRGEQ